MQVGRRGLHKEDDPGGEARAKQPFRLLLRDKQNRERIEEADVVLDCTGIYGQHRWLGEGGIPAIGEVGAEPHISYTLDDILGDRKNHYANKNVLVVGGGFSAATTVASLAQLALDNPSTWVTWLARSANSWPIKRIPNDPLKERDRLAVRANNLATRTDANVEFHSQSVVEAIEALGQDKGFRVTMRTAGKQRTSGSGPHHRQRRLLARPAAVPRAANPRMPGHFCPVKMANALQGLKAGERLSGPDVLRNPEPNYYILGAQSYGRNASFLMKTGFEQVRDVFTLITGNKELDLYKHLTSTNPKR